MYLLFKLIESVLCHVHSISLIFLYYIISITEKKIKLTEQYFGVKYVLFCFRITHTYFGYK